MSVIWRGSAALLFVLLAVAIAPNEARAAGGAFAVDDAGVDDAGKCKVEAFFSSANTSPADHIGVVAPACVLPVFNHRVDFSAAFARSRSAGEYSTGLTIKGKTPIPGLDFSKNDSFGVAFAAGVTVNLTTEETEQTFFLVPVTVRVAEPLLLNFNLGHVEDRIAIQASTTWGTGFELNLKPIGQEKFTILGEVFGNDRDPRKSAQLGLRFTPVEKLVIDLIYCRNLTGENADWLTVGMNVRF